jgi:hypothetical protein
MRSLLSDPYSFAGRPLFSSSYKIRKEFYHLN